MSQFVRTRTNRAIHSLDLCPMLPCSDTAGVKIN